MYSLSMPLFILLVALLVIIALVKYSRKILAVADHSYIKRKTLLTEAERSFLGVLEQAVGEQYRVYAQVRLADVVSVRSGLSRARRMAAQNRINAKHVDFVLCDPMTLNVLCAIELDDASHQRMERKARDAFLEHAPAGRRDCPWHVSLRGRRM